VRDYCSGILSPTWRYILTAFTQAHLLRSHIEPV
jgi:hypothetical protein